MGLEDSKMHDVNILILNKLKVTYYKQLRSGFNQAAGYGMALITELHVHMPEEAL